MGSGPAADHLLGVFATAGGHQELFQLPDGNAASVIDIPGDSRYFTRVLAVTFTMHTAVGVGNRYPLVAGLDETGNMVFRQIASLPQAASLDVDTSFAVGAGTGGDVALSGVSYGLPSIILRPQFTIRLGALGLLANDRLKNGRVLVERFTTDPRAYPAQEDDKRARRG